MTIFKKRAGEGASRANKPFAGKFAKRLKKITENSLIREKSSITGPKSALKISDSTYLQMKTQILDQCF